MAGVAAGLLLGCGRTDTSWMPLDKGHTWTYSVTNARVQYVAPITVSRRLAVAGCEGAELTGRLGNSRLAWCDGRLVAETLAGTRYDPPLILLDPNAPKNEIGWEGIVSSPLAHQEAHAFLKHERTTTLVGTKKAAAIKTTLDLEIGKHQVQLLSWYVAGEGLVHQEQRTNGVQDVSLTIVSG